MFGECSCRYLDHRKHSSLGLKVFRAFCFVFYYLSRIFYQYDITSLCSGDELFEGSGNEFWPELYTPQKIIFIFVQNMLIFASVFLFVV